jgi:hypothetical protein
MNDQEIGKRLAEREDLDLFLEAYELATGESLCHMGDSETPPTSWAQTSMAALSALRSQH